MSLRSEYETSGAWLFRHRSFLPLLTLPVLFVALGSFTYIGHSRKLDQLWDGFSLFISLMGLAVRVLTVGYVPRRTSGRNTRRQAADFLNTTGMYSLVRHPLYFGNYLIALGFAVFFHVWWMPLLATCIYALYYERIMFAEEAFLRQNFGEQFESWAAVTPAIIPKLRGWKRPALPFSWRSVLRREYTSLFVLLSVFFGLDIIADSVAEGKLRIDWAGVALFAFGAVVYFTLRTLKKHTTVLDVPGR